MERVVELKERLNRERPVAWDDLPDISLYKDQVVSYMQRQLISFEEEAQLTSAMINNYIKKLETNKLIVYQKKTCKF